MITRALVVVCVLASSAAADPWKDERGFIEWSSWISVGVGVEERERSTIARSVTPPERYDQRFVVDGALGVDATLGIPTPDIRVGAWAELRAGLETSAVPSCSSLDRQASCRGFSTAVRVCGACAPTHATGSIAWGYRCPWTMFRDAPRGARYMIGGRLVATATRAFDNPNDWSMSLGIEFEPVGTLRYAMAIRSWY